MKRKPTTSERLDVLVDMALTILQDTLCECPEATAHRDNDCEAGEVYATLHELAKLGPELDLFQLQSMRAYARGEASLWHPRPRSNDGWASLDDRRRARMLMVRRP